MVGWPLLIKRGGSGVDTGAGECPSSFVGPNGGRSGLFWVVVGSRRSWVAVVGISCRW